MREMPTKSNARMRVGIRSAKKDRGCVWASEAQRKTADACGHPKRQTKTEAAIFNDALRLQYITKPSLTSRSSP